MDTELETGMSLGATFQHYMVVALPEIVMALGAMVLLMYGVARGNRAMGSTSAGAIALLLVTAAMVYWIPAERIIAFRRQFRR